MAGAFDALLTGSSGSPTMYAGGSPDFDMTGGRKSPGSTLSPPEQQLRGQILQRWGGSGGWDNDSVDLAGDLARRMYASGIVDLDKLQFTPTKRREQVSAEYQGTDEYRPAQFADYDNAFDLNYDGKAVGSKGFIGDINRDGSLGDGNVFSSNTYHPNLLAWNSGGKGAHNYEVSFDEKGNPVVTPVFQSSSYWNSDLGGLTKAAALSVGAYFGAGALNGATTPAAGGVTTGATTGGLAAPSTLAPSGLGAVEFGAITPEMLAGSGTAIQGGGMVGGTSGLATGGAAAGLSSGGSSATKAALYGSSGYGAGMSGLQTSIFDSVLAATGSTSLANGAATVAGSGGDWTNWLKTAWDGADTFLDSGVGKALMTGVGLAGMKDAKQGAPDPMLADGAGGVKDVAKDAQDRAKTDDATWQSIFMPQYLGLMARADARDQELYNFNMGRARLAANQMDKFYAGVDAYDNVDNREKLVGEAGATAEQNTSAGLSQLRRNLGRMSFNPNSGVWLSQMRQGQQQGALDKTMAMNLTREAARREGLNLRATAAGLRGADSAYAGNAAAGSDIAMRGLTTGNQAFTNNSANWRANQGVALTGYGQLGGWGLSRSNSADQLNAANVAGWNGLIGYGLGRMWGG